MSRFCTAKATHIFFSKKFQHICVSHDVNFNESLTNDVVSFEQLGPDILLTHLMLILKMQSKIVADDNFSCFLFRKKGLTFHVNCLSFHIKC